MKRVCLLLLTVLLSGCATEAYRAVERECSPAAFQDYPVSQVQVIQTRQRVIEVATGFRNCSTFKDGNQTRTICTDVTRPEFLSYQELVVIDQNEAVRKKAIESCAKHLCVQRYGNEACKTDVLLVPVPEPVLAPTTVP